MRRAIIALAMLLIALASLGAQAGVFASMPPTDLTTMSKIDKQVLKDTANGQTASFVILLTQQADLTTAYSMKDQDARGWFVYNTLRDTAASSQAPIRAILTAAHVPFQPYWAANMIVATGDLSLVQSLAARPDVKSIDSNDATKWIDDPSGPSGPSPAPSSDAPNGPNTVEWGVQNVNAPQVWAQGYTGQGIVVASQDTGVRWTHNALKPQYRGWNGSSADHNYNWWDAIHNSSGNPCGNDSQQPCDDYFHGSHTTGSAVGSDGGTNQIGVAPGAKWIGCRNMDQGNGTPARYTECFQFMIAPTDLAGQNPNPALRPHVIINSWGCPTSEGCTTGSELETIVNNTQASGIFVEVSAGNSGPGCSSVDTPPALYSASFSTGAIDISNTLAGFSSRGPSLYYTPNLLKPEISAPGVNVRSATNSGDANYTTASGTSMAGPHVVGVVALIWSARPALVRDITGTKQLLEQTANHNVIVSPVQTCGGIPSSQIPNNSFGYGRVDALAAFNASGGGTPTPTVPVPTNTPTHTPTPTNVPSNTPTVAIDPTPPLSTSTPTTAPPSDTPTPVPPTQTPGGNTATPVPSNTPTSPPPTATSCICPPISTPTQGIPTATPTACTLSFTDVPVGSTFYPFIRCLACKGIISGYADGTFKPGNPVTRGQLSKIVSNSAGFSDNQTTQMFQDVPVGSTFFQFVGRLASRGFISGYACGGAGEPCVPPANLPYFRPNSDANRGQISKIVSNAAGFSETPTGQQFEDVTPSNAFYAYIYRLVLHSVMSGYQCGIAPAGACVPPNNLPYFLPDNNATRGQTSKIVSNTFFPDCNPPQAAGGK